MNDRDPLGYQQADEQNRRCAGQDLVPIRSA
jgi:hypothetical protein